MTEPLSVSGVVGKAVGLVAKPIFSAVRKEVSKRGADELAGRNPLSLDADLSAAISVLANDAENAFGQLKVWLKSAVSAPPEIFAEESARIWLGGSEVQDLLKQAAIAFVTNQSLDPYVDQAKRLYGESAGEDNWYGEPLFTHAVAFLVLSLSAEIDTGTRLLLEAGNANAAQSSAENAAILERVGSLQDQLGQILQGQLPVEAMDRYLRAELQRRERLRNISKEGKLKELLELGEQAFNGVLKAASPQTRIELFRFIAAELTRNADLASAETWLIRARDAGAHDLAPDQARLAIQQGDPDVAIHLLNGRKDRLANALRLEALRKAKGESEAIAYFEEFESPATVVGHTLPRLAQFYFTLGRAEDGERLLASATNEQVFENPLLLFQRARARLALMASANAAELFAESMILPSPKALRDDAEGRRLAGLAVEDLSTLEIILAELDETDFLDVIEPQKMYLQLLFDDTAGVARAALAAKLSDPEEAMAFSGLARIFDVPFDPAGVRTQLAQTRRLREWTDHELQIAFQLEIAEHDAETLLQFIAANRERLEQLQPVMSTGVEIEALVRAGRSVEAEAKLRAAENLLPAEDRQLLTDLVADQGDPTLARNLDRYEQSGDDRDLHLVVQSMIEAKDARLGTYAAKMWRARHRIEDAVAAANAFAYFAQDDELAQFLEEVGRDADGVLRLQEHHAWLLYRRGDMAEARRLLVILAAEHPDDDGLRQLEINIALETGDWQRLSDRIEADLAQIDLRSPQQLLQSAALGQFAKHPDTLTLIRAAVAKAPNDPAALMSAWDLGRRLGIDNDAEVSSWMSRAVALGGDKGVVRQASIEELFAMRDENAERAKELDSLIMTGQVTIGMAAKPLGTTITEVVLERIWQNSAIEDPRNRLFLPFYAGNRGRVDLAGIDAIALDLPSIMLLYMTGLLEQVLEGFTSVILPAGTMATLFEHMRQAERGQPSRTKRAALVEHLIDAKRISVLPEAGRGADEIDALWAAAEEKDGIVIHAPPLYVPGSFLAEVRDPEPFKARLVSPRALAEALQTEAAPDEGTEDAGTPDQVALIDFRRFSTFAERWPDERDDLLKRPLMIDGTALMGLADVDLLEPLLDTGVRLFVTSDVRDICARERAEGDARHVVLERIEGLRATLSNALLQGRARVGPAPSRKGKADEDLSSDPLMALLEGPGGGAQVLVSDERVVNRYPQATDSAGVHRFVATSLDLIDALAARKTIAGYTREAARIKLRASGVGLIPLAEGEFVAAARRSDWTIGAGEELKAIRDSILLPLFRRGVQLPEEQPWLTQIVFSLAKVIRDVFRDLDSSEDAEQAADFALACLPDIRGYVGDAATPEVQRWASEVMVVFHSLVANAPDMPMDRLAPFHAWYEQKIYSLLLGRDRDLRPAVESQIKRFVTEDIGDRVDFKAGDYVPTKQDVAMFLFRRVPKPWADVLIQDAGVRAALGVKAVVPFEVGGHKVNRSDLFAYLRSGHTDDPLVLKDRDGAVIAAKAQRLDDGTVQATVGKQHIRFEHSGLFSADPAVRTAAVRTLLSLRTVSIERERRWLERAETKPLSDEEFLAIVQAAEQTTQGFIEGVADQITGDDFTMDGLVPADRTYFDNLAPEPEGVLSTAGFKAFATDERSRISRVDAVIASGPLAVSPAYDAAALTKGMPIKDRKRCCEMLIAAGDPFGLLAAFQIVCAGISSPSLKAIGDRIIDSAWGPASALDVRLAEFQSGAIITSASLLERSTLQAWPLDRRRLATFAHAGHIVRVLANFEVQGDELLAGALAACGSLQKLEGALDQWHAIGWEPALLSAMAVKGYLLRRFSAVLAGLAEDKRPAEWVATLEVCLAEFKAPADQFALSLPGPLDEFTGHLRARHAMDADEYADFLEKLEGADPIPAYNLAYVYPMMLTLPADADVERLQTILIGNLDRLEGDDLIQSIQIALLLAWRWQLPGVAKAVFRRFVTSRFRATTVLTWAVMAAAAETGTAARMAMLEELTLHAALFPAAELAAAALVSSLTTIANAAPELAPALAKARAAAALAI